MIEANMHQKIIIIGLIVITLAISGCLDTSNTFPNNIKVDVYVIVSGENESVKPNHQMLTINKSSLATANFTIYPKGAFNYTRIAYSINVSGIDNITSPKYFDSRITNETGEIVDYKKTLNISILIKTSEIIPKDIQSIYIYYDY